MIGFLQGVLRWTHTFTGSTLAQSQPLDKANDSFRLNPNQFMRSMIVLPALLGLALPCMAAKTPRELAQQVFPSVVMLVMHDAEGRTTSLGSGFFVRTNIIASNRHVTEGAVGGNAKIAGADKRLKIFEYIAVDEKHDLILLKVEDHSAPPLPVADSAAAAVGDSVYSVGNPRGLEGTFAPGAISGVRKVADGTLIQISAPISPGSSGGPIVDTTGKVIGVAVATLQGGQNLNFAIPSVYLSKLIQEATSPKPLKSLSVKAKSFLADLGDNPLEGVELGSFLWGQRSLLSGDFTVSLRNKLQEPIGNVFGLVIFHDPVGKPIDAATIRYSGAIYPGTARRVDGQVDASVRKLMIDREKLESRMQRWDAENASAKAEASKRDAKISELESQIDDLTTKMSQTDIALSDIERQISEIERQLVASEGDQESLLKEHRRLRAEKAKLDLQFNDLALLRDQIRKLKDELSIARRMEWVRRGLDGETKTRSDVLQAEAEGLEAPNTKLEFRIIAYEFVDSAQ